MLQVDPGGDVLGARIQGIDLAQPLSHAAFATIVRALGDHGVVCFPRQRLDAAALKRFSAHFGTLEINVTGGFQEPGHPEVMILSNIVENGRALGLADAGQDWHTDMSYSRTIAYANVLHGIRIPRRDGRPLGDTLFANMQAAYDDLPAELKRRLEGATAIHDFAKFWDAMRKRPGSTRAPLTDAQRAAPGVAPGVPAPPDHGAQGSLRESGVHDPDRGTARTRERRHPPVPVRAPAAAEIPTRASLERGRRADVG